MSFEWRGGVPVVQRVSGVDTTGREIILQENTSVRLTTKHLRINNTGSENLLIFFSEEAFLAGVSYILLTAADPPLSEPIEAERIWVKAAANTTDVEILSFFRRG